MDGTSKQSEKGSWKSYISLLFKLMLVILAIDTFLKGEFVWFIATLLAIFLTFLPAILRRDFNVNLPLVLDVAITLSLFFHTVGGYLNFYESVQYYDHLTHFISSTAVALIGVAALYVLAFHTDLVTLPPAGFGLFTIFFVMSMGVVWEFMEWGIDILTGTQLQHGLDDTMLDFVFDTMAGVLVGIIATLWLRRKVLEETQPFLEVGDIKNSVGYLRWKEITKKDRALRDRIMLSFKDPVLLDSILDDIVEKSHYISEVQKDMWARMKKEFHR
ncbi:MAG: hypothetical protein AYK23_03920 [Candidatus Proteinoplasmatales archaeon SG8-5]|nr:MAG: hypothetical protein AYK23_03920 [Candidatus Proteinoplasmatales archaeon SG8-5]